MRGSRWGFDGPPQDAYGRITEPERFAPLHDFAAALLDRLVARYDVDADAAFGLDPDLEQRYEPARETRRVKPRPSNAAPIAVGFTSFPGLVVRFGRWHVEPFPSCGCDACDEIFEGESDRLGQMVEAVTSGGFTESLRVGITRRKGWRAHRFTSDGGSRGGEGLVLRDELQRLLSIGPAGSIDWEPWPRRG